jgi:predicted regulator of Ras-like GTPase activity (Roadblock/LC7/MglB family)|tara:strand:- start:1968 stop:2513 length:546 start_codon:yes stop_codon:yes gene_type:complete
MRSVKHGRSGNSDTMFVSADYSQPLQQLCVPMVVVAPIASGVAPIAGSLAPLRSAPNQALDVPAPSLAIILDELILVVDGVNGALLASVDGFAVARSTNMLNSAAHAAVLAAAMGLAHQLAAMGGGIELRQLVIDHDQGLLLLWPLGSQRVLAILTSPKVDQQSLRGFVQSKAHWLAGEPR